MQTLLHSLRTILKNGGSYQRRMSPPGRSTLLLLRGARRVSDGRNEIIVERIVLREVRFLSWDEKRYEINYGVDKGNGVGEDCGEA